MSESPDPDSPPSWLEHPGNVDRLFWLLVVACGLTLVANVILHPHGHLDHENLFGFHGGFGFVAYLSIVGGAVCLRRWVKRGEDYYDE
jgi:hypothetical protein